MGKVHNSCKHRSFLIYDNLSCLIHIYNLPESGNLSSITVAVLGKILKNVSKPLIIINKKVKMFLIHFKLFANRAVLAWEIYNSESLQINTH